MLRFLNTHKMLKILMGNSHCLDVMQASEEDHASLCRALFRDEDAQHYLQVNRFQEVLYFNQERFESLIRVLFKTASIRIQKYPIKKQAAPKKRLRQLLDMIQNAEQASGYQVEKFLDLLV